jgi:hypothetical protein
MDWTLSFQEERSFETMDQGRASGSHRSLGDILEVANVLAGVQVKGDERVGIEVVARPEHQPMTYTVASAPYPDGKLWLGGAARPA